ncbi:MAG UNVERIFIED_CONTAM: FliM/FliN family flagellar motor switch protein [Rickettsiaceae bacterium]|jgi:flagellar motor switch protein FliM
MSKKKLDPHIGNKKPQEPVGIKAVLDRAMQAYEKLPMLEIVFERLIRSMTSALRNLTSENVEIHVTELESLRFGVYLSNIEQPSSIAVFKAVEWDNLGLVVLDNNIVLTLVEVLLGGNHNSTDMLQKRALTYIEQTIAKQLVETLLSELGNAFDAIAPSNFIFERLESNPNFATICRSGDAIISLKLNVQIEDKSGFVDIVIPYNTLEPIKEQLQKVFIGDKFGIDSVWEELLTNRIYEINLPIEAVVVNTPTKMIDVAKLKPGDTIVINHKYDGDILLRCKHIPLFKGQVGKIEDRVAINVTETILGE